MIIFVNNSHYFIYFRLSFGQLVNLTFAQMKFHASCNRDGKNHVKIVKTSKTVDSF